MYCNGKYKKEKVEICKNSCVDNCNNLVKETKNVEKYKNNCCYYGVIGATGPAGTSGILSYVDFYALMPPDNAATVAPGTDVSFPQDGPNSGDDIIRVADDAFNLTEIGTYQILFQVSVDEAAQLVLTLNGNEIAYTVVGRATGTSQIYGVAIIDTTSINSILTVRNPADNPVALTITPNAGGTEPVSAHLVIIRVQ